MAILLSPSPRLRFVDQNGLPLAAGKVYTYYAGTLNPAPTYADKDGTPNPNPKILDAAGKGDFWISDNISLKYEVYDVNDVLIETIDDISIPESSGGGGGGSGALRAGTVSLGSGVSSVTIAFSTPTDDISYRVPAPSFINTVDSDPLFLIGTVSNKTVNGFTVKLNMPTDSANYKMEYNVNADV